MNICESVYYIICWCVCVMVLSGMGQDGYLRIAAQVMSTTEKIAKAIDKIDGLKMITKPDMVNTAAAAPWTELYCVCIECGYLVHTEPNGSPYC